MDPPSRGLIEQIPALVYIDSNDLDPETLYISPEAMDMLGHEPDEYRADLELCERAVHPDDRARVEERWEAAFRTGEPFHDEYRIVRPDGRTVWVIDDSKLVRDAYGEPRYWLGVLLDISERKGIELDLRGSEARYRALVEQIPAVVYEMGPDDERRTIYVSRYVEELFGYSRAEWLDQPDIWIELLHPDDREIVLASHDRHRETDAPWREEYRLTANDGRIVWVSDQAVLVPRQDGLAAHRHGIMLDTTERKELEERLRLANEELELRVLQRTSELFEANEMMAKEIQERRRAEEELREAREGYRHLVEDLPAVVYRWHVVDVVGEGSLSYTSPQIEQLLGYSQEEWDTPTLWIERLHPHDRDRVLAASDRSAASGEPFDQEYRYLSKDGRVVWVHSHATLLKRDDDGNPLLFQGVTVDITERKEAEVRAADVTERLRATEMLGSIAFFDFEVEDDATRRVVFRYVTPELAGLISVSPEDLERDPTLWLRSIHPDDSADITADVRDQLRSGRPSERTYRVIGRSGHVSWVRTEARCVARHQDGTPRRFQGVLIDVTREKQEQERARESDAAVRAFVEALPGIPWMHVVEHGPGSGRTIYLGPQVERILGYTEEELLTEPDHFGRMIHPGDRDRIRERSTQLDRTLEPWSQEYRMIARDGHVVWLRSEGVASRDEQGAVVWHGIAFDVTSTKDDAAIETAAASPEP